MQSNINSQTTRSYGHQLNSIGLKSSAAVVAGAGAADVALTAAADVALTAAAADVAMAVINAAATSAAS